MHGTSHIHAMASSQSTVTHTEVQLKSTEKEERGDLESAAHLFSLALAAPVKSNT